MTKTSNTSNVINFTGIGLGGKKPEAASVHLTAGQKKAIAEADAIYRRVAISQNADTFTSPPPDAA